MLRENIKDKKLYETKLRKIILWLKIKDLLSFF